jgi:hypothetical protein
MATYIGSLVVDTTNIATAAQVAAKALNKDAVRGAITVDGKRYRWSTIQQYEYHDGFEQRKGNDR